MSKEVRRGFVPTDEREFNNESLEILKKAQDDILIMLDRDYDIDKLIVFIGNHYMLSARQRLALIRSTSDFNSIKIRKSKEIIDLININKSQAINIDGLNLIITLEVALSNSTLIHCMDNTLRDLAGLHGTYRLIDKTDIAINLIGEQLSKMNMKNINFYLDSPVSNTLKLKHRILELLSKYNFNINIELPHNADVILENQSYVISSDAIILNKCISWINMAKVIVDKYIPECKYVELSNLNCYKK